MTVTKEWMKTLAIRSDFDFNFSWFRVLILGFRVYRVCCFGK
jgi:hypothetical protein